MSLRPVKRVTLPQRVKEGAGVEVNRVFGHGRTDEMDPFLMLDHFQTEIADAMSAGFPWHPHRGIETITYILEGSVEHQDSLGNKGVISGGDVQWMTAGSGIIHQEMPKDVGRSGQHGFQLWANLPSERKMTDPRYQDISSNEIPEVIENDGARARIITGEFWGRKGPVTGIASNPRLLDITIPADTERTLKIDLDQNAFAYVFEGSGAFKYASSPIPAPTEYVSGTGTTEPFFAHPAENRNLILFDQGDEIRVQTFDSPMRFLLVSGRALREPVAWHGPIVMNTEDELREAFREYQEGTFLRHGDIKA